MTRFSFQTASVLGAVLALSALWVQPAEARRGGSFGSRGSRTYYAPAPTRSSQGYVAPIQRSMTTRPAAAPGAAMPAPAYAPQPTQPTLGSRFGGFGGGMLGGLLAGGLIGGLLGHGSGGFGGGAGGGGFLMGLIQIALIGGIIWFVVGWFRRKSANGSASVGNSTSPFGTRSPGPAAPQPFAPQPFTQMTPVAPATQDIAITDADKAAFERLLIEVQDAFGHEDYARLRACTTPEIMSYLSEELSQNATHGLRNDVTGTRLIDAEISEAWNEGAADFATIAMHYESIDVMRDRTSSAITKGDPGRPSETTELWTFVREGNAPWKLSAIQET